jgi:hypothetical protein
MAIVTIPDRKLVRASSAAAAEGWDKKLYLSTQRSINLLPDHLGKHISYLLDEPIQKQKVVVLAGFTGEYSHTLHKAGLDVIHTDILDCYVDMGRKSGLQAMRARAESPPRLKDVSFYSTFEFGPIHSNIGGEILMLMETLVYSKHGLIETSLWDNSKFWEHLQPVYNFDITSVREGIARYKGSEWSDDPYLIPGFVTRYHADLNVRNMLSTDLAVIDALQRPETNEIKTLAGMLKLEARKLRESLNRISTAVGLRKHKEKITTYRQLELF